jgi:uncharacterized protein YkwD
MSVRLKRLTRGAIITCVAAVLTAPAASAENAAPAELAPESELVPESGGADVAVIEEQAALSSGLTQEQYETRLQSWINRERSVRGLVELRLASCSETYAERWATYLTRNNKFEHQSMQNYAYACNYSMVGEILPMADATPYQMVKMWMGSSGHRAVLLTPGYRLVGIGARHKTNGQWVGVVDFGRF